MTSTFFNYTLPMRSSFHFRMEKLATRDPQGACNTVKTKNSQIEVKVPSFTIFVFLSLENINSRHRNNDHSDAFFLNFITLYASFGGHCTGCTPDFNFAGLSHWPSLYQELERQNLQGSVGSSTKVSTSPKVSKWFEK